MQIVQVSGSAALLLRREDSAARIVVSREDLLRHGDSTLSATLKRQPGIAIGANGELLMRGLGAGYTQVLLNGDPTPPGFSIDSLAPELIERVEILRSASADMSSQAIAGTINVILKKTVSKAQADAKLAIAHDQQRWNPSATLQLADKSGGFSYALGGTASRSRSLASSTVAVRTTGAAGEQTALRHIDEHYASDIDKLSLAPRLNWTLENGDTLSWQSLLDWYRSANWGDSDETTLDGSSSEYPLTHGHNRAHSASLRSDLAWNRKLADGDSLQLKLGLNRNSRRSAYRFEGDATAGDSLRRAVDSHFVDNSWNSSGKYLSRVFAAHGLAFGWDGALIRRDEARLQNDSTPDGRFRGRVDEDYQADVRRLALFVQDEWELSAQLQAYLGLRWEGLDTATRGRTLTQVSGRSSVVSPIVQLRWKPSDQKRDQFRLALARSYKAPSTRDLVPRRYTTNNDNGPVYPDIQGNPALRPELAWGLDLAYEAYIGKDGVVSLSTYARRIRDVTVRRVFQQGARWVDTPENGGQARAHGIEFDARLPLATLFAGAPALDLRLNAARNWSSIAAVPGPDNRIASQVPLTANAGIDFRASDALSLSASLNRQSGGPARASALLSSDNSGSSSLDLVALWKPRPGSQWKLGWANVLRRERSDGQYYQDPGDSAAGRPASGSARVNHTPSYSAVRLSYEQAL
ncbi:TonB-dependent receptor [Oxalobacteraceae bacterium]|nr:TonB-dependent receptor [Oxalobacteraceae bacterium]